MVITKEGMYPEFTVNGVEYTAERLYTAVHRIPVATIRCSAKYPEDFETDVPSAKKKLIKLLHYSWLLIPAVLLIAALILSGSWKDLLRSWEAWVIVISVTALILVKLYRAKLFYYNYKQ